MVFCSCLSLSMFFPSKSDGAGANFECPHSKRDQKTFRATTTECHVSCIKTISKADCLWHRLQVSCRRHILEKMLGNLERKIAQKHSYLKKLEVHIGCLRKKPCERNFRRQLNRLVFQSFAKQDSSCHLFCKTSPVPRRNLEWPPIIVSRHVVLAHFLFGVFPWGRKLWRENRKEIQSLQKDKR